MMNFIINRRHIFFSLLALLFLTITSCEKETTTTPPPVVATQTMLFVANQLAGAGALSHLDLESGAIQVEVAVTGTTPSEIIQYEDKLYVINYDSHEMNIFQVMDNNTLTDLDTVDLGRDTKRYPVDGEINDQGRMYITNSAENTVSVFDLNSSRILAFLPVGQAPGAVKVLGDKVYVCNTGKRADDTFVPGSISVISASANSIQKTIPVGTNPIALDLDPSGRLHIICAGNYNDVAAQIVVINTQVDTVSQFIDIGGMPLDLAITQGGIGYIAAGGWTENPGIVYRYNTYTGQILNGPNNPIEVGMGAHRVIIGPDGQLFVSCQAGHRVDVVMVADRVESHNLGNSPGPLLLYRNN